MTSRKDRGRRVLADDERALWERAVSAGEPVPLADADDNPVLTDEDLDLWRRATARDQPLRGRLPPPAAPNAETNAAAPERREAHVPSAAPPAGGTDKRTAQRLSRGLIRIDLRLDLHGMTQAEAHRTLTRTLARAQAEGRRCVLVITGKGVIGGETGVLRRMAPRWLSEPPNAARVLATAPARQRHGGGGAFYVLLRKARY